MADSIAAKRIPDELVESIVQKTFNWLRKYREPKLFGKTYYPAKEIVKHGESKKESFDGSLRKFRLSKVVCTVHDGKLVNFNVEVCVTAKIADYL